MVRLGVDIRILSVFNYRSDWRMHTEHARVDAARVAELTDQVYRVGRDFSYLETFEQLLSFKSEAGSRWVERRVFRMAKTLAVHAKDTDKQVRARKLIRESWKASAREFLDILRD